MKPTAHYPNITVCLHRGSSWIAKAIQWQTRSEYSHASLLFGKTLLIEAREGKGVQALPGLTSTANEVVDTFRVDVTQTQAAEIEYFVISQLGKPYDWTMVARFVSRRQESRASAGKWFCSELVYAAFQQAGISLLRDTDPWEVSPGLLARSPLLIPLEMNVRPYHPKPLAS